MQFECNFKGKSYSVKLQKNGSEAEIDGRTVSYTIEKQTPNLIIIRSGTKLYRINNIAVDGDEIEFSLNGKFVKTGIKDEQQLLLEELGFESALAGSAGELHAPMPGKILELMVSEGDQVEENEPVIILEAMKMENELKSPATGIVSSVNIAQGDNVEKNQPLLEIEPRG